MEKSKRQLVIRLYILIFSILAFLEAVFRLSIMGSLKLENFFRIFLFMNAYALILVFLIRLLPRKIVRYFSFILILCIVFFYFTQDLYYRVLSGFFSFSVIGDAHAGFAFLGKVFTNITWVHILYLVPVAIAVIYFRKYKSPYMPKQFLSYVSSKDLIFSILLTVSVFFVSVYTIPKTNSIITDSPYAYSSYDLYVENPSAFQTINKFGVLTYLQRDIVTTFNENDDIESIDEMISSYLDDRVEHQDNAYTGYFEGKNLILIMAESFDTYAIDPSLTPNIYEMQEHSWNFTQYYSPLYFRNTADTEFMSQTGLYAHKSVNLTMETFRENKFPNTLPGIFNDKGYGSYSFHNYTDYFYPRSEFHPNTLGYDEYYGAVALGMLEEQTGVVIHHDWQSDLDLANKTMDILKDKQEPFFTYMLTVSGHLPYNDNHPIGEKNINLIRQIFIDEGREMPIDDILYYHAANYELDLAVGALIDRLEEENMADDTVIMLYGDHYAYGLNQDDISDYDDTKDMDHLLSIQRVPMMIYHPDLVKEDKDEVFASIDIMPTIANLFNLDINYRQVFGKDIFSNQMRSVLFSNGSILTEDFLYNLEKDEITLFNDDYSLEEANLIINEYIYRIKINQWILEVDYFNEEDLEE
ncbi:LTA synthase family protein [Mariniplasma anaerobium]|uniref:Sulfatase n=1 Tax=Mariniplasma anaerobium TaxID=2735436 RepID=A0A7U9TKV4_9MOLU|nr:LTA synthase family protein [Mariniplasma anaerobium]BCR36466.1 sulfatase [Mariniplasma anaerobium]